MPKTKTNKSILKRIKKITARGKFIRVKAGQDHFNARESGKTMRNKRRNVEVPKTVLKTVKKSIQV